MEIPVLLITVPLAVDVDNAPTGTSALSPTWYDVSVPYDYAVIGNTIAASLNFANASARTFAGLQLTSGTGYGDAQPLTTVSASSSGSSVTVADATWFYDGWSIPGESGDWIKIGSTVAQVTTANWTTNVLTMDRNVPANKDDEVYLMKSDGVTQVTNRGCWT